MCGRVCACVYRAIGCGRVQVWCRPFASWAWALWFQGQCREAPWSPHESKVIAETAQAGASQQWWASLIRSW